MTTRTLLQGGCVLTLGARTPNYLEADVLIEDGRIADVGLDVRARGAEVVDVSGTIVMPGFVDTHRHAWRSLFRNYGEAGGAAPVPSEYGPHHTPDDIYAATLIGLLGAVESGITTVVDWADAGATDAALQAHADSGLRTVLVHASPSWDKSGGGGPPAVTLPNAASPLTTIASGSPDPVPGGLDRTATEWESARRSGARIHTHVGTGPDDAGLVAELGSRGLLGSDITLVHCSTLAPADLDAISASGARVSLTPSSEMAGGLGVPPIQPLIDRGIRPGLGVDDERVAPGDMFAQMRATNSIQHATMFDLKLAGKAGLPNLLTTREVIRYATIDGAGVAGLAPTIGSIEVGKSADLIVLRTDRPNISPVNDPIGAVVWGMDTSNIDWVFVNGTPLMRGGVMTADVAEARRKAMEARQRVAAASGLLAITGGHG